MIDTALSLTIGLAIVAVAAFTGAAWLVWRGRTDLAARAAAVAASESEIRRMFDELPGPVLLIRPDSTIRATNAAARQLLGSRQRDVTGRKLTELVDEWCGDDVLAAIDRAVAAAGDGTPPGTPIDAAGREPIVELLTGDDRLDAEGHGSGATGRRLVEMAMHVPGQVDPDDDVRQIVVRLRDVTERERHRQALDAARRRFQQAFQSAPAGMALVRFDDGRIVDANQALADMLQVDVTKLVGCTLREFTHPEDVVAAQPHRARLELGIDDSYRLDQRFRRADGQLLWARTRVSTTEDDGVMLAITHIEDVSDQVRAHEQLHHAAYHDELTGLPNRTYMMHALTERLDEASERGALGEVAVLFVDVDQFKIVNDSLGHHVGDDLIGLVGERLKAALRTDVQAGPGGNRPPILARFGGDEFVIVVNGPARAVAERLRLSVQGAFDVGDHELFVTVSVGYARNDRPGSTAADLLRDADAAMYRAKARGRNCVEAYEAGRHEDGMLALRTAGELRRGLERGEVVPYYQPIVDLASGRTVGYEVLARWLHPDRGLLTPNEFLPLAEETGLLVEMGASILRDSLAQLARWRSESTAFSDCKLSINVATRQLLDSEFADVIAEALAETGVDAGSVWLEITETALLADVKSATAALRELRSLGLHLSVDDFGTGYSSLTYLKRFPVEAIKIDRSFVGGLGIESDDTSIVEAVVQLGHALGLHVVAEGIESPLQLEHLRSLGCDSGQGYLFSRPRPAALIPAGSPVALTEHPATP